MYSYKIFKLQTKNVDLPNVDIITLDFPNSMTDPYVEISRDEFLSIQKQIGMLDLEVTSVEGIFEILKPLKKELSMTAMQTGLDLSLFRGVKWGEKPNTIDMISYPPKSFAKINRASQEGKQLFYSSTSKNITLYEMYLKVGDRIVISEWRPTIALIFPLIGYSDENLKRMASERILDFGKMNYVNEKFAIKSELHFELVNYLSETFCQPIRVGESEKYKLTIAISRLFYRDQYRDSQKDDGRFSGLVYPSIKGSGNHDNFAVNVGLIDSGLIEPNRVEFIEILEYDSKLSRYKYRILDFADSFTNYQINWKNANYTWSIWDNQDIYFGEEVPVRAFTADGEEFLPD